MRTIGYIRVSTEEQANDGQSIDAQRAMITRYCELHELEGLEFVMDAGISGSTLERPGLQRIVAEAEAGEIDQVVVTAIDRLSRSTRDVLHLVVDVFDGDVGFHSVKQSLDTSSAMGRFVLTQWAALAELERGLISERTSDALQQKVSKGERVGRAPFGFRPGPGELDPDPETMEHVYTMFEMRANGARLQQIADHLNERGIPSSRGGRWGAGSVKYVLGNTVYARHLFQTHVDRGEPLSLPQVELIHTSGSAFLTEFEERGGGGLYWHKDLFPAQD